MSQSSPTLLHSDRQHDRHSDPVATKHSVCGHRRQLRGEGGDLEMVMNHVAALYKIHAEEDAQQDEKRRKIEEKLDGGWVFDGEKWAASAWRHAKDGK